MADTENVAAAASNPAEAVKTESSDVKPTTSNDATMSDAKADNSKDKSEAAGEEKWELNGNSKDKDERRGGRNDRNDRNGRFDRFNDRRDGGRGRGRGRGGFNNNTKKFVAHPPTSFALD